MPSLRRNLGDYLGHLGLGSPKINLKMYSVHLVGVPEADMRHEEINQRGKDTQWTV